MKLPQTAQFIFAQQESIFFPSPENIQKQVAIFPEKYLFEMFTCFKVYLGILNDLKKNFLLSQVLVVLFLFTRFKYS